MHYVYYYGWQSVSRRQSGSATSYNPNTMSSCPVTGHKATSAQTKPTAASGKDEIGEAFDAAMRDRTKIVRHRKLEDPLYYGEYLQLGKVIMH